MQSEKECSRTYRCTCARCLPRPVSILVQECCSHPWLYGHCLGILEPPSSGKLVRSMAGQPLLSSRPSPSGLSVHCRCIGVGYCTLWQHPEFSLLCEDAWRSVQQHKNSGLQINESRGVASLPVLPSMHSDLGMHVCCRPQYNWGSHMVRAYWVFFKTEQERRRSLSMTGRCLVSTSLLSNVSQLSLFSY